MILYLVQYPLLQKKITIFFRISVIFTYFLLAVGEEKGYQESFSDAGYILFLSSPSTILSMTLQIASPESVESIWVSKYYYYERL